MITTIEALNIRLRMNTEGAIGVQKIVDELDEPLMIQLLNSFSDVRSLGFIKPESYDLSVLMTSRFLKDKVTKITEAKRDVTPPMIGSAFTKTAKEKTSPIPLMPMTPEESCPLCRNRATLVGVMEYRKTYVCTVCSHRFTFDTKTQ